MDQNAASARSAAVDPKAEQILSAAKAMFLELGYDASSMDLVAQRARVSKTTLYTRFPSKEALFAACVATECKRSGMRFAPEELDHLPLADALMLIGRRLVDLCWSQPAVRIHQVIHGEATRFPELARIFFEAGPQHGQAALAAYFARAAARGLARIDDPTFVAGQFVACLQGGPHCQLMLGVCDAPPEQERHAFVDRAVRLFLDGLPPRG